jgi:subtilisin family serine protease
VRVARRAIVVASLALAACASEPVTLDVSMRMSATARADSARQIVVTITDQGTTLRSLAGASPRAYAGAAGYRGSPFARRIAAQLARDYRLERVAAWRIDALGVHCVVFRTGAADERDRIIERLQRDPRVESVQPMQRFGTAERAESYNDPYFRLQRGVEALRVPAAHRWSQGRGVRVAIVDTRVDSAHPELAGRVRIARNFVDRDDVSFRGDRHGTAVAGVIGAAVNNSLGIVGVAPQVELLALKACWHERPAAGAVCNTLTLAAALAFALEADAQVINLSLTGPRDALLERLVATALRRNVLVVGADPGNGVSGQSFPADVDGVLAVSDADASGMSAPRARIAAPGREVLTLVPSGRYDYVSGASFSGAMVSGIAALLLERARALSPSAISAMLERTASPAVSAASAVRVVNACDAVAQLVRAAPCSVLGRAAGLDP